MDASLKRRQQGVVLFIALIVIVAMALAGLALIRSVDTNVIVAGNIAFKQAATNSAEQGVEAARQWLIDHKATLSDDQVSPTSNPPSAYYSNWQDTIDLTGTDPAKADFNWDNNSVQVTAADTAGNRVRYVVHRLCEDSNTTASSTICTTVPSTTNGPGHTAAGEYSGRRGYELAGAARTSGGTGGTFNVASSIVYYRITVRVDGPRNTRSYVQALMY